MLCEIKALRAGNGLWQLFVGKNLCRPVAIIRDECCCCIAILNAYLDVALFN
jgi:hypothetical protein